MRTSSSVGTRVLSQQPGDGGGIEALAEVAVAARGRRRGQHRVEHRLLRGVDDRLEDVVECAAGDDRAVLPGAVAVAEDEVTEAPRGTFTPRL